MMKTKETVYESPSVEIIEIQVEQTCLTISSLTGESIDDFENM